VAAEETGTKIAQTMWADAGDGGYLLIKDDPRLPLRMLERFVWLIGQRNELLVEGARVRLRYALHYGPVFRKGSGRKQQLVGDAINDCARLLSGIAKDRIGQVVASGAYRDKVLTFGTIHAGLFTRLPDITDKHGKRHEVWNVCQKPGFGIEVETPPDRPR
jgi:class 3 adenylate cyclase